jgi:hypothetical protein
LRKQSFGLAVLAPRLAQALRKRCARFENIPHTVFSCRVFYGLG